MGERKLADLTVDELKTLIADVVDERLRTQPQPVKESRSVEEVLAAMDRLRWKPPAGAPTTTELLREDRDR